MTHDRSHDPDQAHLPHGADHTPDTIAPGHVSRSAELFRRASPEPSGLVARDDNGVAAHADEAVAGAASSSGSPLPAPLLRKFESSLGADLSSVRVHTGDASATAAHAVGAKAYTVGQDIHFGAGHFDPSSPAGEHLLAHEVAHTVQQAGRMQFKLAVSSPGDHFEHEADRAADAMVAGQTASVGSAGASIAREMTFPPDKLTGKNPLPQMKFPTDKSNAKDVTQKNNNVATGAGLLKSRATERILTQAMKVQDAIEAFDVSAIAQIDAMKGADEAWDLVNVLLGTAGKILSMFVPGVSGAVIAVTAYEAVMEKGAKAEAEEPKKAAKAALNQLRANALTAKGKVMNVTTAPIEKQIFDFQFGKDEAVRSILEAHQPDGIERLCDRLVLDPSKQSPYEQVLASLGQKFAHWRVMSEFHAAHTKAEAMMIEADPSSKEHKQLVKDLSDADLAARLDARKSAEDRKEPGTSTFPVW